MLRNVARHAHSACRAFSSASPSTQPRSDFHQRVSTLWDKLMFVDWVDNSSAGLVTEEVDAIVGEYRTLYNAKQVESPGPDKDTYEAVERLYIAGEAAKIADLYADHMTNTVRDHMDMTGVLGNETHIPEESAARAEQTLREYIAFANSLEDNRIRRKVEAQLGQKAVLLRQVLSVDGFSAKFAPVATDHIVTNVTKSSVNGRQR